MMVLTLMLDGHDYDYELQIDVFLCRIFPTIPSLGILLRRTRNNFACMADRHTLGNRQGGADV